MANKQPTITGEWQSALLKVMDSLGDENYSFYNIDVTKTADPEGRASIYFAMKVIVPRSDIAKTTRTKKSIMPDGLLQALSADQVRDLIAFLQRGK